MFYRNLISIFLLILLEFCLPFSSKASHVAFEKFGLDSTTIRTLHTIEIQDSFLNVHPLFARNGTLSFISKEHLFLDKTFEFYFILILVAMIGLIRYFEPQYLSDLFRSLISPSHSGLTNKEKTQSASFLSFCLNIFFTISVAVYVCYLLDFIAPNYVIDSYKTFLIPILAFTFMIIYLGKYLIIKFSGWAFRIEDITERYLYNVFVLNKVLGLILLPFIVIIAFGNGIFEQTAQYISIALICLMFLYRYVRSWQVFGTFFRYSKFHFFTYLCASELLPLAVLMKLLVTKILT